MTGKRPDDPSMVSDGYHTFAELYRYRMLYHALWVNEAYANQLLGLTHEDMDIHKSMRHHDGTLPFPDDDNWFIVVVQLPTGQIRNHYRLQDWEKFQIPIRERAAEWDGHTPEQAADRMAAYLVLTADHS